MKNLIFIFISLSIFCTVGFGQDNRKTTFRVLGGINSIAKTNFRNEIYQSRGWATTEYHEKPGIGLSFQLLASFYLSKKWKINTGLMLDEKGYVVNGTAIGASDAPFSYSNKKTANYFGIPLEIERVIFKSKTFSLSIDAGLAEQWKVSGVGGGQYFLSNQFTFLGGLNLIVPFHHIAFIAHPIFRYSPTQLEDPLIGGSSPSFNAYSVGLELGVSF